MMNAMVLGGTSRGSLHASLAVALFASLLLVLPDQGSAAEDQGRLTPIVVSPLQQAFVPFEGSDGRWHVMYEFELANTLAGPADLRSVTAVDTETKDTLLSLDSEQIIAGEYLHTLNRTSAETTVFESNQARILILNLSFPSKRQIPERITHRFVVDGTEPFSGTPMTFSYPASGRSASPRRSRRARYLPAARGRRLAVVERPSGPTSHVNAIVGFDGKLQGTERYAADWIQIDPTGRIFTGDRTVPENWFGYGAPIVSAGKGVVTEAREDLPNQTPGVMPSDLTFDQLPGNYVSVKMKGGFTAVYAHLVPESVTVDVGDKVRVGERIGLLGQQRCFARATPPLPHR